MVCTNYTWKTKPGSNFTRYNFNIHNQELTVRYFKKLHRATLLNTNWFNEERIIHWLGGYSWNCAQKHRNIRQKLRSFWMWSSGCISVRESENICSLLVLRCSKKCVEFIFEKLCMQESLSSSRATISKGATFNFWIKLLTAVQIWNVKKM